MPPNPGAPSDVVAAIDRAGARSTAVQLDVRWFSSVTSTMDVAAEAVQAGASEGLVILAEEQSAGRGRRGRAWSSPLGAGAYLSFVLRPPLDAMSGRLLSLLTLAAGVAVRSAILNATGFAPELKWPNDVMAGRLKLAGILAEGVAIGTPEQAVILGVGANLLSAAHPGDVAERATSLETELGRPLDRGVFLEEVLVAVADTYNRLRGGESDGILREWRAAAPSAQGAMVEWNTEAGVRQGTTAGVDDAGALLIRTPTGLERVISGDVRWL